MATEARRNTAALVSPVDPASLVVFRVGFGVLMLAATVRFVAHGWVHDHFLAPTFFFKYWGFEWVRPWPGAWMYAHYAAMALAAALVALGLFYRASAAAFFVLFTYAHLIDKTHYLNHYYLVSLLSALMIAMPLGRVGSIDALRDARRRADALPAWTLWLLRFQFGVVYLFGGVAKLSYDWLAHAQPLTIWLAANGDFPVLGPLFGQKWFAYAFSWAGAAFDLSVVFLLLRRATRPFGYAAAVAFHVVTAGLFQLGMFPWIMLFGALLFFSPSWPRRWVPRRWLPAPPDPEAPPPDGHRATAARALLCAWAAVQVLLPLRHHLYPGPVTWTEEGFRFSWNVMLMEKNGTAEILVTEPATKRTSVVDPHEYLTRYQAKMMATQPDMVLALAHHVGRERQRLGVGSVEVRAEVHVSLNARPAALLVDPSVDLMRERDSLAPKSWILPLPSAPPRF